MKSDARKLESDRILAEFIAKRNGEPIVKVRRGKSGMKLVVKPQPIIKAEYESEAKLDGQSMGLQSCKLAMNALYEGKWDVAAKLMVMEHTDRAFAMLGITRLTPFISATYFN